MPELSHQNLLLDVGDTLVKITQPFEQYTLKAIESLAIDIAKDKEEIPFLVNSIFRIRNEVRAEAHKTLREFHFYEFLERVEVNLGLKFNKSYLDIEKEYVQAELEVTERIDGVIDFLTRAKNASKRLIVSTNNFSPEHVKQLLIKFELSGFIDEVFISGEMKVRKPAKEFIDIICKEESLKKKDTIIIGDKPHMDILAAMNSGIDSCWYNPNKVEQHEYAPTFMVNKLSQINFI